MGLAFILVTSACASTPGDRGSQAAARKPLRGGIVELRVTSFDGRDLHGRVLLGATVDPLVIDERLVPWSDLELENIRACDRKERLKHWVWEALPQPPRAEQIITVYPGYWYGADVIYALFDKSKTTEPDCFEADLVVRNNDRRVAARQPIRVVRTDRTIAPSEGGTEEAKPPPADAGAP